MPVTDQDVEEARGHLLKWLKFHMDTEDITQAELAVRLGVTPGLITQWFSGTGGTSLPSFKSLLAIKHELDVEIDFILRRDPWAKR